MVRGQQISAKQVEAVWSVLFHGESIFLTGQAGTGKSLVLNVLSSFAAKCKPVKKVRVG